MSLSAQPSLVRVTVAVCTVFVVLPANLRHAPWRKLNGGQPEGSVWDTPFPVALTPKASKKSGGSVAPVLVVMTMGTFKDSMGMKFKGLDRVTVKETELPTVSSIRKKLFLPGVWVKVTAVGSLSAMDTTESAESPTTTKPRPAGRVFTPKLEFTQNLGKV